MLATLVDTAAQYDTPSIQRLPTNNSLPPSFPLSLQVQLAHTHIHYSSYVQLTTEYFLGLQQQQQLNDGAATMYGTTKSHPHPSSK